MTESLTTHTRGVSRRMLKESYPATEETACGKNVTIILILGQCSYLGLDTPLLLSSYTHFFIRTMVLNEKTLKFPKNLRTQHSPKKIDGSYFGLIFG